MFAHRAITINGAGSSSELGAAILLQLLSLSPSPSQFSLPQITRLTRKENDQSSFIQGRERERELFQISGEMETWGCRRRKSPSLATGGSRFRQKHCGEIRSPFLVTTFSTCDCDCYVHCDQPRVIAPECLLSRFHFTATTWKLEEEEEFQNNCHCRPAVTDLRRWRRTEVKFTMSHAESG